MHGTEGIDAAKGKVTAAVVGIDLGGTKILAGIADLEGKVLATLREETAHGPGAPVLDQMAALVGNLAIKAGLDVASVCRVVIGVPSAVSPKTGLASLSPNLALPEDRPLAELMSDRLRLPVDVENDVNLAAFGEAVAGAGRGLDNVAFLSFGTGVGLGLVVDGRMLRGAFGRAGEIAYLPTGSDVHRRAPRSENGLFEDEVGTRGVVSRNPDIGGVRELFERAEAGDATAREAIDDLARRGSVGLASVHALIDPEVTVIGGGIGSQPWFFERIRHHLAPLLPFDCHLEPSRHGAEAGMLGAVLNAVHRETRRA
ncbi:ROK family protein [Rhizobium sp. AQ_MP]|uniref:ROK family protein n=1 Tax=Rhizobium sp. AQ_MP TaxID=2761536 RepID=UPI00163A0C74|nr:ROK family protein [Rhizobium sp. AQ_MP]MBC2771567.1 ROK family protein [Rhizobium sp. AQ_MP]